MSEQARQEITNEMYYMADWVLTGEEHKIYLQIADKYGFSRYMLSPAETLEMIHAESKAWVYADNQLIQADQVNEDYLSTVSQVRLLPGIIGGEQCEEHLIQVHSRGRQGGIDQMLTADATREFVHEQCSIGCWAYVRSSDGGWDMYSNELDIDWKTVSSVRIAPGLVGLSPQVGEEE